MIISLCIIILGLSDIIQGLEISSKFMFGDVIFIWAPSPGSSGIDILITLDKVSSSWTRVNDTQYTVRNALLYEAINIRLRSLSLEQEESERTFKVFQVKTQRGDNANVTWIAPFFPSSGQYNVYHTNQVNRSIFIISNSGVHYNKKERQSPKYQYLTRPLESTNIAFMIRNTTLEDSGYYAGGVSSEAAWMEGGVVLIVLDKPSKPEAIGDTDKMIDTYAVLTCSSNSTSGPDYYSKLVTLSYTWFVNDKKMYGETNRTLQFKVTRGHKYNWYSCAATAEDLESDRSDTVQMNPLYGPEKLILTPQPTLNRFNTLTIKEGATIGPYQCKVDCNPPCDTTWKYKDSTGSIHTLPKEIMLLQQVTRNISLFLCEAKWGTDTVINKSITLKVQYLEKPIIFINDVMNIDWEEIEHTSLQISCYVNGNPPPTIRLIRGHGTSKTKLEEKVAKWLNYTIESSQFYHSDNYMCAGSSSEFNISRTMFKINVLCKPRYDDSVFFKTIYGSKSGRNIKVKVAIPLVANPAPQLSNFSWVSPESKPNKTSILQGDVIYKHWIESVIDMYNRKHFGNYTLLYNGETIATIKIILEDKPRPPVNVTVKYLSNGYINLTWISEFNGGPEQFFILSLKEGSNKRVVANITDPGEGKLAHTEIGPLTSEMEHFFYLQSCNSINCSSFVDDIKVTVKDDRLTKTSLTVVYFICSSVMGLVLVMAGIFVFFKISRGSFRQTGEPDDKNIDSKSHGVPQHYDDLHGRELEVAYTALGQSEKETTYEDM